MRFPRLEILNGAEVTTRSLVAGRNLAAGAYNWPTAVVDRAKLNITGTDCVASGEFVMPAPDADSRFSVPLGMEVNAGYYVFCYDAGDDIELSAQEMK